MIAIIFEVEPAEGKKDPYLAWAQRLRPELEKIDGMAQTKLQYSVAIDDTRYMNCYHMGARITSYNVCYTKLLRWNAAVEGVEIEPFDRVDVDFGGLRQAEDSALSELMHHYQGFLQQAARLLRELQQKLLIQTRQERQIEAVPLL